MSKAYQQHLSRHQRLQKLGKDLTRRSNSCCELCEAHSVKLVIHEVPPVPEEPVLEHVIFVCEECAEQLDSSKRRHPNHWHCLSKTVWSTEPCVQVTAVWMAKQLADQDWVAELLDQLYLQPEIEDWLARIEKLKWQ